MNDLFDATAVLPQGKEPRVLIRIGSLVVSGASLNNLESRNMGFSYRESKKTPQSSIPQLTVPTKLSAIACVHGIIKIQMCSTFFNVHTIDHI